MASHENFVPDTQSQPKMNSVNIGSSQSIPETQNIVIIICVHIAIRYFCNIFLISKFYSQFALILQNVLIFGSFGLSTKEPYTIMNCPSCIILHCWCWHQCWCQCLCTPPLGTGLDTEMSYLVHIWTYVPHICTSNI